MCPGPQRCEAAGSCPVEYEAGRQSLSACHAWTTGSRLGMKKKDELCMRIRPWSSTLTIWRIEALPRMMSRKDGRREKLTFFSLDSIQSIKQSINQYNEDHGRKSMNVVNEGLLRGLISLPFNNHQAGVSRGALPSRLQLGFEQPKSGACSGGQSRSRCFYTLSLYGALSFLGPVSSWTYIELELLVKIASR